MDIHLTVILRSKDEHILEVKNLLLQMVENARKETGCLQYDLHQSTTHPHLFVFHEVWKNQALFELHNAQDYIKDFFSFATNALTEAPTVLFTTKLA